MLNKTKIVNELVERGVGDRNHVRHMLDELAKLAAEQVAAGERFLVPNVATLNFAYRAGQKKGATYKVVGTGEIKKREEAKPAKIVIKARPAGRVNKAVPTIDSKAGKGLAKEFKAKAAERAARAAAKAAESEA